MMPGAAECPKCQAESPCTDWNEVDIGIGVQEFDHCYTCPEHGEFAFTRWNPTCWIHEDCRATPELGAACANDGPRVVFRDDEICTPHDPNTKETGR